MGHDLRGGSYYQPQGSIWYFPQAYRNDQHEKLLLMAPSYDRSGTVGFRQLAMLNKSDGELCKGDECPLFVAGRTPRGT